MAPINLPRCACLLLALLSPIATHAADACRPVAVLPRETVLRFERQDLERAPTLEGLTARELILEASPDLFGLDASRPSLALGGQVVMPAQRLGYGVLQGDKAALKFEAAGPAHVIARMGERRYLLRVFNNQAVSAEGAFLDVAPLLTVDRPFILAAGTKVSLTPKGQVAVAQGSRIIWDLDGDGSLSFALASGARLEESGVQATANRLAVMKPVRVLPGGNLQLQVNAAGFDFRTRPLAFCFSGDEAAWAMKPIQAATGKLLSQSGDEAVFEVRVPPALRAQIARAAASKPAGKDGSRDVQAASWADRVFGVPARVRVMGFDGDTLAVDTVSSFTVSDARISSVVGVLVLTALLLLTAAFVRQWNPFTVLSLLVKHPSGRYSLSNLQVLLWTLLVIFALCYVWVSTGELLAISSGILVLLGISGTSSVLARTLDGVAPPPGTPPPPVREASRGDWILAEDGTVDLLRFQMLGFTLFTWLYSLMCVLRSEGLPEIPESLYVLMGISNAAYIGGKLPAKLGASDSAAVAAAAAMTPAERALASADILKLQQSLGVAPTGRLDEATRAAVAGFKLAQGIVPANGAVTARLMAKVQELRPQAGSAKVA